MKRMVILFIVINSYGMQQSEKAAASPPDNKAALIYKIQTTILPVDIDALMRSMETIEIRLKETGKTTYTSSRNDVKVIFLLAGLKAEIYTSIDKTPIHTFALKEFKEIILQVKAKTEHID